MRRGFHYLPMPGVPVRNFPGEREDHAYMPFGCAASVAINPRPGNAVLTLFAMASGRDVYR